MDLLPLLLIVLLLAVVVIAVVQRVAGVAIVHDYERGLHFVRGKFVGLTDTGITYYFKPATEIRILDVRPRSMTIEGQEVLTSDRVALKISLVARWAIGDPAAFVMSDDDAARTMYLDIQLGLREVVADRTVDEILAARSTIGPEVLAAVAPQVVSIGIELLAVEVRDVMVPSDLKRAFAAVVAARHEGAAALERARGETAALRSLANAGRMVGENPGLLSLRVVQEVAAGTGNTIMFSMDGPVSAPVAAASRARRGRTAARADEA